LNRDEPNGCFYVFHVILFFGLGGEPSGFLCCSTATEQQKFTMANDTSCVEVLSLVQAGFDGGQELPGDRDWTLLSRLAFHSVTMSA
jgi:hypothetical protein